MLFGVSSEPSPYWKPAVAGSVVVEVGADNTAAAVVAVGVDYCIAGSWGLAEEAGGNTAVGALPDNLQGRHN